MPSLMRRDETGLLTTSPLERAVLDFVGDKTGAFPTPVPGLEVARFNAPGPIASYLYEPSLCMIARGAKRTVLGDRVLRYNEDTFLLTSVGLPTVVQIERASEQYPYVAFQLFFDLDIARQLIVDMNMGGYPATERGAGMVTGAVTEELLDAVQRLLNLIGRPEDAPFLAQGIHREILYRLLTSPSGAQLRQTVRLGTQSNRAAKAVALLRQNFRQPLRIERLAEETGMAVSTLHRHFKTVTSLSPLQFQKHLRLHEARRLMLTNNVDAGVAASQVGYESVTQFNREYRRLFGAPPKRDVLTLRATAA